MKRQSVFMPYFCAICGSLAVRTKTVEPVFITDPETRRVHPGYYSFTFRHTWIILVHVPKHSLTITVFYLLFDLEVYLNSADGPECEVVNEGNYCTANETKDDTEDDTKNEHPDASSCTKSQ